MLARDARHVAGEQRNLSRRLVLCRAKNADEALLDRPLALTIAPARRLGDLVETRVGPPDAWKVEIDAGLDERGGDQAAGSPSFQTLADIIENAPPVRGVLPGGQMDGTVERGGNRVAIQHERMGATVNDDEALRVLGEQSHEIVVGLVAELCHLNPLQLSMQARRIRSKLALPSEGQSSLELRCSYRRLGCRAEHNRGAIIPHELVDRGEARAQRKGGKQGGSGRAGAQNQSRQMSGARVLRRQRFDLPKR